jgi:hypothetical protein
MLRRAQHERILVNDLNVLPFVLSLSKHSGEALQQSVRRCNGSSLEKVHHISL